MQPIIDRAIDSVLCCVFLGDLMVPRGTLMMVESGCTGQGSNTTGRVPWTKTPSAAELAKFVDLSYVSGDGWLAAQPR